MKLDKNSVRFKIIAPVLIFVSVVVLLVVFIIHRLSIGIVEKDATGMLLKHSSEVETIVTTAISELTIAALIDNDMVVENKKRTVAEEIVSYWKNNNLTGLILEDDNKIIFSSLDNISLDDINSHLHVETSEFHLNEQFQHFHGYLFDLPLWNWKIVTVYEPIIPFVFALKHRADIVLILLFTISASALMLAGVLYVMRANLKKPLMQIIDDIKNGRDVNKTGITELDTVGSGINNAINRLNKQTSQYQALHSLAISIYEYNVEEEILQNIIDKAGQIIGAEHSAIGTYDSSGKLKKLVIKGTFIKTREMLPEGKGLFRFLMFALGPVRIDNVVEHPEFSGAFPEGHPIVKNLLAYPIYSSEGRPLGMLYFGNKPTGFTDEDETILKAIAADAAIAITKTEDIAQLRRFKQVINSAFDVIVITDYEGNIINVNPAFVQVTGYTKDEVIGKKTNILKSDFHDEGFYKELWDTIKKGKAWKGEFINRRKDGQTYHASSVIFPVYADGEINYASIQRDITHEKKLYEQLVRAQKMEAIGTLAGGIAHDFNNILTAIMGYSDILLTMSKEGDPLYKPAHIINNAAQKGAELAKKILLVTRKEKMEMRPVNINEIIKNSIELLSRSIPKNIEIVANLKDAIPFINADPSQIQQVIMNLSVNARDAMPNGGRLLIETSAVKSEKGAATGSITENNEGFIKLSVSDTGSGMDKETQRKIFDPFFTTKDSGKGTGLGLYIVHSVISNHGGYVNLYSEPSKGTLFNIYLPCTKDAGIEESEEIQDMRGAGTILIIDDEDDIRDLSVDMLEPLGYKVLLAENGSKGINMLREHKEDVSLVILDMIMPKMSGNEVFQALRTIKPDLKVLLCSGYSHEGFAGIDKLLENGAAGFVQKPFTLKVITESIKKILDKEEI